MKRPIWVLLFGIALIVLGALAIIMPQISTLAVEVLVGWLFLLSGLIHGWSTFRIRGVWNIGGSAIIALLSVAVGVLLLLNPLEGILDADTDDGRVFSHRRRHQDLLRDA